MEAGYATHTSGYNTFDVSNPDDLQLLMAGATGQFGWKHIVANGSGVGLAAVDPNSTDDGAHDVFRYDVSNPEVIDPQPIGFPTPGIAVAS